MEKMEKGKLVDHDVLLGKEHIMPKKRNYAVLAAFLVLAFAFSAFGNTGLIKKVLSGGLIQIGDSFVARFTGIAVPPRDDALGGQEIVVLDVGCVFQHRIHTINRGDSLCDRSGQRFGVAGSRVVEDEDLHGRPPAREARFQWKCADETMERSTAR